MRGLPGEAEQVSLDPGAPAHRRPVQALGLQHGSLLDVELEVGAQPALPTGRLRYMIKLNLVFGKGCRKRNAVYVTEVSHLGRVERPGECRATEEAAAEAGALLVRPVDQRQAPRRVVV